MTHNIYMPTRCIWGNNAVRDNSSLLQDFGSKCLIITGRSGAVKSGALSDITSALNNEKIEFDVFNNIDENPLISVCYTAGAKARSMGAEFIIGIGGGSVLDAAKAIAIYASNSQLDSWDIYKRTNNISAPLPVVLVGTTAGTGSEVTGVSVLTNDNTGIKKSISGPDCYAKLSFCDPKYTYSLPYKSTVSTALDAFCHAVEGFFTPKCQGVVKLFAQKAIPMIYNCLKELSNTNNVSNDLREPLYYGSIYAGLVINTCGTAFPHPLGYVLTENFGIPHGMACGAFFKYFLLRCKEFAPDKFREFIRLTEDEENVIETISSLVDLTGVSISPDEARKFSSRWEKSLPKNFLSSPGSLTREEAEKMLIF